METTRTNGKVYHGGVFIPPRFRTPQRGVASLSQSLESLHVADVKRGGASETEPTRKSTAKKKTWGAYIFLYLVTCMWGSDGPWR